MDASTLMGIYGLGQQDPGQDTESMFGGSPLKRNALAASLMGGLGKPVHNAGEGAGQLGNAMVAALLMNPKMLDQMGQGFHNLWQGNSWGGQAPASSMAANAQGPSGFMGFLD